MVGLSTDSLIGLPSVWRCSPRRSELEHHLPVSHLRVVEHLASARDRAEADVQVGELRHPLRHGLLAERRPEDVEHRVALGAFRELLLDALRQAELRAQVPPEVRLERADRDVAAVAVSYTA